MAKIVLVGSPRSQEIVPLSKYLVNKYLPYEVVFLNHEGELNNWSKFVADYLETLPDEKVIFGLDDYLLCGANLGELELADGPCVKLCETTWDEHKEYPVTTQYTLWDKQLLISILRQTTSPWDFEVNGSKLLPIKPAVKTCIYYDTHSALSGRWEGINFNQVKAEDIWNYKSY